MDFNEFLQMMTNTERFIEMLGKANIFMSYLHES